MQSETQPASKIRSYSDSTSQEAENFCFRPQLKTTSMETRTLNPLGSRQINSGHLCSVRHHNKSTELHGKTMKTICPTFLSIFFLVFVVTPSARADLYLTGNPNFGPNSITVDTSTGLGWLNVSKAVGLSYQQVLSETHSGGIFTGFRLATVPEVLHLYSSAGLSASAYGDISHYYPASSPSIQTFFSLLGTSGTINGLPGIIALSGTSPDGGVGYISPSTYGWDYAQEYWVSAGGTEYGATFSDPGLSSWLVEVVPEPAVADFFVLAAVAWCGYTLLHRRERAV